MVIQCLFFCFHTFFNAPNFYQIKGDSLISDQGNYDSFYKSAEKYLYSDDYENAIKFGRYSIKAGMKNGDSLQIVKAQLIVASALRRSSKLEDALEVYDKAICIAENNRLTEQLKILLNSQSVTYTFMGNYDKALGALQKSLIIRESIGDIDGIRRCNNNLGLLYYKLGYNEKALEYYYKSLDGRDEEKETDGKIMLFINIGLCYGELAQTSQAIVFIEKALSICKEDCSDEIRINGEFGLGKVKYDMEMYDEAIHHLNRSLYISRKLNDARFSVENLLYLVRINLVRSQYKEALVRLKECEAISSQYGFNELLLDTYKQFRVLNHALEDYDKLVVYQKKYMDLQDNLHGRDSHQKIAVLQAEFEGRNYLKTIEIQNKIMEEQEKNLAQNRVINIVIGVALVLSIVVIMLFFYNGLQIKRQNIILDKLIQVKTSQLDVSCNSLVKTYEDLKYNISVNTNRLNEPLATLKGICHLASQEKASSSGITAHVNNISNCLNKFSFILNSMKACCKK